MNIRSEISQLNKVIIHNPGVEHLYTLPENTYEWIENSQGQMIHNPDYLLFDDLISPNLIESEHNQLSHILMQFTGDKHTLYVRDLLRDVLQTENSCKDLFEQCLALDKEIYNHTLSVDLDIVLNQDIDRFIDILISGRYHSDTIQSILQWPLPNLIFSRDISSMIGNTLLISWAKREARKRETLIMSYIVKHHSLFKEVKIYDFHKHHPTLSIEGGDIIIFDSKTVFIGLSERNSKEAIDAILPVIFDEGFSKIIVVDLPKSRTVMHLDTIFSRISHDEILVYPPLYKNKELKGHPISIYYLENGQSIFDVNAHYESLSHCLQNLGYHLTPIFCGGNERIYQEREQWSDGANAFALESGKIICYSRNTETMKSLEKSGYSIVNEKDFLRSPQKWIQSNNKIVFSIDSAELPRGRGGPRCLTLPLHRV